MKKLSLFLALIFHSLAMASPGSICLESLVSLLENDDASREQVQKFLNLQSSLTMHKLSYAAFRNEMSRERFKLEDKILELSEQINTDENPEFVEIRNKFRSNPMSRHHLAAIMPYVQNIMNDQLNEEDPVKKELFLLGANDLKMLSILGEAEIKQSNGVYDSRLYSNVHDIRSVLNIATIINSSIRNSAEIENIRDSIKAKIEDTQKEIKDLIESINMPQECREIRTTCVQEVDGQEVVDSNFLNLILEATDHANGIYRYKYLRYGSTWLHTGYERVESDDPDPTPTPTPTPTPEEEQLDREAEVEEPIIQTRPQSDHEVVQEYLINHVLDHLPYFVDRETLAADEELTRSLAQAIDNGVLTQSDPEQRFFIYNGAEYYLPEMWNSSYANNRAVRQFRERINNNITVPIQNLFNFGDEFEIPNDLPHNLREDFERVRNEQLHIFDHQRAFEFRGRLYDINSGQLIPANTQGLLGFKKRDLTEQENRMRSLINLDALDSRVADAIRDGQTTYLSHDIVHHISGARVDLDREHSRAQRAFNRANNLDVNDTDEELSFPSKESIASLAESNPTRYQQVLGALANRDRAISDGENVYDLYSSTPFTPLTITRRNLIVNESRVRANLAQVPQTSADSAAAILNNNDVYYREGRVHHSLTGREIASTSDIESSQTAFRQHDILFARESQINDQGNIRVLEEYFRNNTNQSCQYHPVIDKEQNRLNIYDNSGQIIYQREILLGVNGDQNRRPFIPAGIHTYGEEDSFVSFRPIRSSDVEQIASLGNNNQDDNRITNSAIALLESDLAYVQNTYLTNNCPFYVLPEEDDLRYSLNDGELEFSANNISPSELENYNLHEVNEFTPRDIQIHFNNTSMENNISRSFADTLALRKPELMQNLGLSNSEYNELAKLAVAILGVESGFGTETAYQVKEFEIGGVELGQMLVSTLKWNERADEALWREGVFSSEFVESFDTEGHENSRGLTQIKSPREYLREDYPEITEQTLNDPANAAIATMYVLASKYRSLERISHSHPAIRESNKFEYLYTVYSGSTHRIQTRNATPRLNSKSAEVRAYVSNIELLTR